MLKRRMMTYFFFLSVISMACQNDPQAAESPRAEAYEMTVAAQSEALPTATTALDDRYHNARYHFSIAYPKGWQMIESENQDGATFTHPTESSVRFSAYGSEPLESIFTPEEIAEIEDPNRRFKNYEELQQRTITVQTSDDQNTSPVKAKLRKIAYTLEEVPYQMLQWTVALPQRTLSIECEAPTERFAAYETIFEEVTKSIEFY